MKRLMLPLTAFLFAVSGQTVWAQQQLGSPPTNPFSRPQVSPYINLARPGASGGINYFGLVQPQVQTQNGLQQLQQQQAITTQSFLDNSAVTKQPILDTGSGARFMTYSRYFMTVNRSAGGGTGAVGGIGGGGGLGGIGGGGGLGGIGGGLYGQTPGSFVPGIR